MRTTLELDRELLEKTKTALGASSFTEAIETALRQALARVEARSAWDRMIGSEGSWDRVEDLLRYRRHHGGRAL